MMLGCTALTLHSGSRFSFPSCWDYWLLTAHSQLGGPSLRGAASPSDRPPCSIGKTLQDPACSRLPEAKGPIVTAIWPILLPFPRTDKSSRQAFWIPLPYQALTSGLPCLFLHCLVWARILESSVGQNSPSLISDHLVYLDIWTGSLLPTFPWWCLVTLNCLQ